MNVFNFDFEWIQFILQKVGSGVTPLALVSVGLQLRFESEVNVGLGFGLLYKLIDASYNLFIAML
jgi:hypothetical protein